MAFRQYVRRFRAFSNVAKKSLKFGAAVVVGAVVYSKWKGSSILHAARMTGYEPSVKWDYNWDSRDPEYKKQPQVPTVISQLDTDSDGNADTEYNKQPEAHTPTASRHILLIRHGQYDHKNGLLASLGLSQADLTGRRLKELDLSYTMLISSTMSQAKETANHIHKYLPNHIKHISDDNLCNGVPSPSEPPAGPWRPEQTFHEDGARIESAFRKYFYRADANQKKDSYEIIVCHANVIRYFICRVLQFQENAWIRFSLAHCSISEVVIRPSGRVSVQAVGDHGHLPKNLISFS